MKTSVQIGLLGLLISVSACSEVDSNDAPIEQTAGAAADDTGAERQVAEGPVEFTLPDLDGRNVNLSDYRGKFVVVNYWATWCAPCRKEIPEFIEFQNAHEDVQILGIAYEDAEVGKLKAFTDDFNINYPILTLDVYDPPEFAKEGGRGLPTTVVYDRQGHKHAMRIGPVDGEELHALVFGDSATPQAVAED